MAFSLKEWGRLMRVKQWIKNSFVAAPILVSTKFDRSHLQDVAVLFVVFCLAASTVYILNDLWDRTRDQAHPIKKYRPLARGTIQPLAAVLVAALLFTCAMSLAWFLGGDSVLMVAAYFVLNIFYTLFLKEVAIIDLFAVACNYLIRVLAGALVIQESVTPWLVVLGTLLALFLAIGKRRGELVRLGAAAGDHRKTLAVYSEAYLDKIFQLTATATVTAYIFYTLSEPLAERVHTIWMPLTIPFVLYGVFRYMHLLMETASHDSPTETLLADRPLLLSIAGWCVAILLLRAFPVL